jgi:hypothetical protein
MLIRGKTMTEDDYALSPAEEQLAREIIAVRMP